MQPLTFILIAEFLVYLLANLGDWYITTWMVRWYGTDAEANPEVRRMYESGRFGRAWMHLAAVSVIYFFLNFMGTNWLATWYDYPVAFLGGILPAFAAFNLVRGGWIFAHARK